MGNRAVITFSTRKNSPCIYLHWNGGRASVEAFLQSARILGLRYCDNENETIAKLAHLVAHSFFGCDVGLTVYLQTYGNSDTDNYDNGVYILNRDLSIKSRKFIRRSEEINTLKTDSIIEQIISRAPIFN